MNSNAYDTPYVIEGSTLQKMVAFPLSDDEIEKFFGSKKANIVQLNDITPKYNSINEVFGEYNHIILFIATTSPTNGHWIAIVRNSNGIYWMDSLAMKPLNVLNLLKKYGYHLNGQTTYILKLIASSKQPFRWNNIRYQINNTDVNTCGRYATFFSWLNSQIKENFNIPNVRILMKAMLKKSKLKNFDQLIANVVRI